MMMRRRPLMRAAVVGGGAYMIGKSAAKKSDAQAQQSDAQAQQSDEQNQRIDDLEQQKAPSQQAAPATGPSLLDQLNQLDTLHQQGALTDNEFTAAKAKLLG
jgi:glutamine synthetase adenylyltransferase